MIFALLILITSVSAFGQYAVILLYHRFGDERYPSTSVPLDLFRRQMAYLKEKGYRVIPLEELLDLLEKGSPIPPKTVVITVDDGYKSTMKAYEILKEFGYPFTLFLYMEAVGRYPDFLTLEDIETLKQYGKVTFGNHSYSHGAFGLSKDTETFLEDLRKSEERFKKLFGKKPDLYAFPYGYYNREIIEILKDKGYRALFTQDPGSVGSSTDKFLIPRVAVVGSWATMEHFIESLHREPLPVRERFPREGFLEENPPAEIGVYLLSGENYERCAVYVSEQGWRWAKKEGNKVYATGFEEFKRKWNRLGVRCKNKRTGALAYHFWMILK